MDKRRELPKIRSFFTNLQHRIWVEGCCFWSEQVMDDPTQKRQMGGQRGNKGAVGAWVISGEKSVLMK